MELWCRHLRSPSWRCPYWHSSMPSTAPRCPVQPFVGHSRGLVCPYLQTRLSVLWRRLRSSCSCVSNPRPVHQSSWSVSQPHSLATSLAGGVMGSPAWSCSSVMACTQLDSTPNPSCSFVSSNSCMRSRSARTIELGARWGLSPSALTGLVPQVAQASAVRSGICARIFLIGSTLPVSPFPAFVCFFLRLFSFSRTVVACRGRARSLLVW